MKKVILLGLLLILVGALSACTPQLSDQQIKEDILNIVEFRSASLISDQTTISKEKDGDLYHVSVSAAIDKSKSTYPCTVKIEVTSTYIKTEGKWKLDDQTYVIDQIVPAQAPKLSDVVGILEDQLRMDPPDFSFFSEYFQDPNNFVLVSTTPGTDPSSIEWVIETVMVDGPYSNSMRFTVDCDFDRDIGWTFAITDWIKHESMDWTGTYDLVFTVDEPGFPSNYLNQFYDVGDEIKGLVIQGSYSITRQKGKTPTETGTIEASFSFKGIDYHLTPVIDGGPNRLWIKLGPFNYNYEDSDLILSYTYDGLGSDHRTYILEALCMRGEVTKLP